jgi:hypothetical protein
MINEINNWNIAWEGKIQRDWKTYLLIHINWLNYENQCSHSGECDNGLILGWDCLLYGGYFLHFRDSGSHWPLSKILQFQSQSGLRRIFVEHPVVKITPCRHPLCQIFHGPPWNTRDASAARLTVDRLLDSGDPLACTCNVLVAKGRQNYKSGFTSCNRPGMKCDYFLQCN